MLPLTQTYSSISDQEKYAAYGAAATAAISAFNPKLKVFGAPADVPEGTVVFTVVIEFDSVEAAKAAYASEGYQSAMKIAAGAMERTFVISSGI